MCGIAGIIYSNSLKGNGEDHSSMMHRLRSMVSVLEYRGPDGEGLWIDHSGTAALGHRRLSIIDLSDAAAQPMHFTSTPSPSSNEDAIPRYTIVHNGEIYNYIELKEELRKKGYAFRSESDTEVILAAYDCWKDECVDHFDGMFAFAIWDAKQRELFAARDRFGEKPFFYHFDDDGLLFGSEMKALWAAGLPKKPNQKMLFNFITIGYVDNPNQPAETFFENISKLPPATILKYNADKHELILEKYWDIDPEEQDKKINEATALEQFSHLLYTSVKRRLRSDVPVGSSLSGGLDSSSVVAIIASFNHQFPGISGNSFSTFTAIFPGFEKDEYLFAKQVTDRFGLKQQTINVSVEGLLNDWEKLLYHQEEPFSSASVYAQYKVFELSKTQGVKVLLDGQGADETLAGYHKYYKWFWQELFHKRKLLRSGELKAAKKLGVQEKFGPRNIVASLFPDIASVILERQYLLRAVRHKDFNKEFVRLQSMDAYYTTPTHFNLNGVLHFNTCLHGLEELLRYADRNSMAHGREIRLPFLSHELVEFVFSLPSHYKIRHGWTKWLLRESVKEKLPESIVWRKEKIGFEAPEQRWMENKQLQGLIREAKKKLVNEKILNPEALEKPIRPMDSHDAENYDWRYLSAAAYL